MFKWKKLGRIWAPSLNNSWMQEYGQNPNAMILDDRIRIYFSSRKKNKYDGKYVSYIFFIDVEKHDPSKIIAIHNKPLLNSFEESSPNDFDKFGTMPGSVLFNTKKNEVWLYYVGWQRPSNLPYQWANGLAISKDSGVTFKKFSHKSIISPAYKYPYLQACPRVYQYNKNTWHMWYASGIEWYQHNNTMHPVYVLMSADSRDGINWMLSENQTIPSVGNKECQSSASVIKIDDLYHMFFSFRDIIPTHITQKQYRIGYAWSHDLINWHRDDTKAGINTSKSGWDSEAICYPHVVNVDGKIYMFYSGNQYGCSGFGYAELLN